MLDNQGFKKLKIIENKCEYACYTLPDGLCCLYMISKYSHIDRNDNAALANEQAHQMQEINRDIARANQALAEERYLEEQALMEEVHRNHEERWHDAYEDFDYGYHDQYDF